MTATLIDSLDAEFIPEFIPEFAVRLTGGRPGHAVFVRRRLLVGLVLAALCVAVGVTARTVLADRGGVPASTPAIQPETVPGAGPLGARPAAQLDARSDGGSSASVPTYIVQPGDTLWSIAGRLRGKSSMSDYVDQLVSGNGGTALQAGQLLILP